MSPKYFHDKASGVNADLQRHNKEEEKLIFNLRKAQFDNDPVFVRAYTELLDILKQSKAELVSKIGKK